VAEYKEAGKEMPSFATKLLYALDLHIQGVVTSAFLSGGDMWATQFHILESLRHIEDSILMRTFLISLPSGFNKLTNSGEYGQDALPSIPQQKLQRILPQGQDQLLRPARIQQHPRMPMLPPLALQGLLP
jgi:hypothetical protein